jgi:translation elongation factor EF-1alpha
VLFKGPGIPTMCQSFKASISTMSDLHHPLIPGTCLELYLYGSEVSHCVLLRATVVWAAVNAVGIESVRILMLLTPFQVECRVTKLHSMVAATGSTTTGKGAPEGTVVKNPKCIPGSAHAVVTISLDTPVLMETSSGCRALARFALRALGKTVAVGACEKLL